MAPIERGVAHPEPVLSDRRAENEDQGGSAMVISCEDFRLFKARRPQAPRASVACGLRPAILLVLTSLGAPMLAGAAQAQSCTQWVDLPLRVPDEIMKDNKEYANRAELSAVLFVGKYLAALSNEAINGKKKEFSLQIFEGDFQKGYDFKRDVVLFAGGAEADFEGLAVSRDTYFAVGSQSRNRPKQKSSNSAAKNRENLGPNALEDAAERNQLLSFKLSPDLEATDIQVFDLRTAIQREPILEPFTKMANKENGVDVEGLEATDQAVFVGFRGPVFRGNLTPVLKIPRPLSKDLKGAELLFVNLGGRGVRGMTAGPGGEIFILAGPNGDEEQSFAIYAWDGKDQIADNGPPPRARKICDLGIFPKCLDERNPERGFPKPEGITYVDSTQNGPRFLLVFDGPPPLRAALVSAW